MSAHAFISHRMFVAALDHNAGGVARSPRLQRVIDISPGGRGGDAARPTGNGTGSWPVATAPQLLTTVISGGLRAAGA